MHPTSEAQFETTTGTGTPDLEHVRDGLFCYGVPQPGTLPHYALSYLLLDTNGAVHVIDAGWDSDENWQRFIDTLAVLDRTVSDVASVSVTHLHPDHLGMATRIRAASGAPVAIHEAEQAGIRELSSPPPVSELRQRLASWGVPDERYDDVLDAFHRRSGWQEFTADRFLSDGERLDIPGHSVRVLHTPGHTSGHVAFVDDVHGVVFLGDLLLPNQFPGIGLGGTTTSNPIDDYLASLGTVATLDNAADGGLEALPGHGYRFRGITERCAATTTHHETRTAEVAAALTSAELSHAGTVWDVASTLTWTAGWENLHRLALMSALMQTSLHMERAQRL